MEISFDTPQETSDLSQPQQTACEDRQQEEIDLEDGEIEDDDEEVPPEQPQEAQEPPQDLQNGPSPSKSEKSEKIGKKMEQDLQSVPLSPSHSEKSIDRHSRRGSKDREKVRKSSKREHKKEKKEDKDHRHMTEAERSILHLRKKEKLLRHKDKWPKKEPDGLDDDFAKNIEKTLATILHKKEKEAAALTSGNEEVEREEKRGKKRKKHSKDKEKHKTKRKRTNIESPRSEIDENEMLNIRSGSPGGGQPLLDPMAALIGPHNNKRSRSPSSESYDDEEFSNEERDNRPRRRFRDRAEGRDSRGGRDGNRDRSWRNKKDRNDRSTRNNNRRDRDMRRQPENSPQQNNKMELQDSQGVCVFYMQGKCQKSDCPYSHEASPPMKLELCKFYLMDCCAKGDNCSYMHGEFPCKFYHTGLQCTQGDDCKFAHGAPLSEGLKQILFKHIETAPRDILGGFPRLSREEALNLINVTQKKLQNEYANPAGGGGGGAAGGQGDNESEGHDLLKGGIPSLFDINVPVPPELAQGLDSDIKLPSSKQDKKPRVTRWHQKDDKGFPNQFSYGSDQDMRITSNGDIDMRTLPALVASNSQSSLHSSTSQDGQPSDSSGNQKDVNSSKKDVDIRQTPGMLSFTQDVDSRQPICFSIKPRDVDIRPQLITKSIEVFQQEEEEDEDSQASQNEKREDTKQQESEGSQFVPSLGFSQSTMDLIARITANNPTDLNSIPVPQTNYQPTPSSADQQQQQQQNQLQDESNDNINWYSDDDDDDEHRLTIKVEEEENRRDSISKDEEMKTEEDSNDTNGNTSPPPEIKPTDIVGKLGDLSKIDISAEVTKLLTSMSQNKFASTSQQEVEEQSPSLTTKDIVDPRIAAKKSDRRDSSSSHEGASPRVVERRSSRELVDPRTSREKDFKKHQKEVGDPREVKDSREAKQKDRKDPRLGGGEDPRNRRKGSVDEKKTEKLSIYEQGGLDMQAALNEIESEDFKSSLRPDIDLRNMTLPFKGMQNYTPATEIDASLNSHLPMAWKVATVDIPRPDYTGLKLSINDAEKTGDPRLRKLFRLSIEEKDSPMSPKASPKTSIGVRVDPRLRKTEEKPATTTADPQQITYNQQLTILQSSQFYQSLTSNQKLMLNQELADRYQQDTGTDPFLFSLLTNLNLLPNSSGVGVNPITSMSGAVQNMLPSLSKLNHAALPILAAQGLHLGQQGLLGAAPGIPNIPMDFPINFDPRNGGLLGNGPGPVLFGNQGYLPPMEGGFNNEDFYQGNEGPNMNNQNFRGGHHNRDNRNFNNRDNRRRGGRNNFNSNSRNNNRDFKNNRGGRNNNRQNRHHSPE